MTPAVHLIEPYAGTASAFRHALSARPPRVVGWMGSKGTSTRTTRSLAAWTLDACGVTPGQGLASATLMDAGPWGWVWPVILHPSSALQVAEHLRRWAEETPDGRALWDRLAAVPPPEDLVERVGAWLWLQARSASGVPLWWEDDSLLASDGRGDPRPAGQRGGRLVMAGDPWPNSPSSKPARQTHTRLVQASGGGRPPQTPGQRSQWRQAAGKKGCSGIQDPTTVAARIEDLAELVATWGSLQDIRTLADRVTALAALPRPWVGVYHGRCEDVPVEPFFTLPGRRVVILDPPYVPPPGEKPVTGYGVDCTWTGILDEVQRWAAACGPDDVVAVHHAYDLSDYLEGDWHAYDVTCWGSGKTEWLTLNREPSSAWRRHHRIALRHWSTEPAEQLGLGLGMAHAG